VDNLSCDRVVRALSIFAADHDVQLYSLSVVVLLAAASKSMSYHLVYESEVGPVLTRALADEGFSRDPQLYLCCIVGDDQQGESR